MNYFKFLVITVLAVLALINSTSITKADPYDRACALRSEYEHKRYLVLEEMRKLDDQIRQKERDIREAESKIEAAESQITYWENRMKRYIYVEWGSGKYIRIKPEDLPDTPPDRITINQDYKTKKHKEVSEEQRLDGKAYHKFVGEESNYNTPFGKGVRREIERLRREIKKLKRDIAGYKKEIEGLETEKACKKVDLDFYDRMIEWMNKECKKLAEQIQPKTSYVPQTGNSYSAIDNVDTPHSYAAVPLSIKVEVQNDPPETNPALLAEYLLSQSNTNKTQVNNDLDSAIDSVARAKEAFNENRGSYSYTDNYVYFSTDSLDGLNVGDHVQILSALTQKHNDKNKKNDSAPQPQTRPCNNNPQTQPCNDNPQKTPQEPQVNVTPCNDPPVIAPCTGNSAALEETFASNPVSPCSMNHNTMGIQNNTLTPTLHSFPCP